MMAAVLFLGIAVATFAASGIFFFKFWRVSRDPFFLCFGIACWLIAIERLVAFTAHNNKDPVLNAITDTTQWVYLMRLIAFLTILYAIWIKNRGSGAPKGRR